MKLHPIARSVLCVAAIVAGAGLSGQAPAQPVDCARLQQLIARGGSRGGDNGERVRRQAAELARTQAMAQQLGCGGFSFFGGDSRCAGLTQRIQGLQAGMAQLRGSGGNDLVATYNAYCRGGQGAPPPQPKGFFESLFGGGEERRAPLPELPPDDPAAEEGGARGGSQAVCVRTCDGGFFPLPIGARHGEASLTEMCHALCPGTDTAVFTRSPNADIKTAAGLDGKPYADLPNALKFEKSFVPTCSCRQPGKSWAETLANAEQVLGETRKGDIVVTKEKSDELSRPKLDPRTTSAILGRDQSVAKASPADAARLAGANDAPAPDGRVTDGKTTDGKAQVRRVGPQN